MRLGFAVQVLGEPGLKSSDTRRWQNSPHLSVSLAYLRDILGYLRRVDVRMYRLSSNLAPYLTHPEMPQFHNQIAECESELRALGHVVRQDGLRLSFHPAAHVVLNAPDPAIAHKAAADLVAQASILDFMGLGPEAVVVLHVGGVYDDKVAATQRFVERFAALDIATQRRLVLENDERAYSIGDTYAIHRQTGIRLVLDQLHYHSHPTAGMRMGDALALALSTWPEGQTPKIHYSTPRTSMTVVHPRAGSGKKQRTLREPRVTQHADLIDPFAFIGFLRMAQGQRDFDVMLECKAKDVALLRLRRHLARFAPDLVAGFQTT